MEMRKWEHVPVGFSFEPHTHPADISGYEKALLSQRLFSIMITQVCDKRGGNMGH